MPNLASLWPHLLALGMFVLDVLTTCHVVLNKRDARSAIAWTGLIWFVPVGGSLLYLLLGVNRIERRARWLRATDRAPAPTTCQQYVVPSEEVAKFSPSLAPLAQLVGAVSRQPLLRGNTIIPHDRQTAFPAMLTAIAHAQRSIGLTSYLFDNDPQGRLFVAALAAAVQRGVAVRVLVDDVGSKYSRPSILGPLRQAGVPHAVFLPRFAPWAVPYANLRNHRKILVIDGAHGFTGGMNLRQRQSPSALPPRVVDDHHFELSGPVVQHLQQTLVDDWQFTTNERLGGGDWFPELTETGPVICRGIADGPDESIDNARLILSGALNAAQKRVVIVTPYFLPDRELISSLNLAALRGVVVDIVLPQVNNLYLVEWASMAMRWQVLERGCRIWRTPPPFDHTKLMMVDGLWTFFGSSNWDPRSLRLNFEFNVECYDPHLASRLMSEVDQQIARSQPLTLAEVDGRSLPLKLRDGLTRLLSPYL